MASAALAVTAIPGPPSAAGRARRDRPAARVGDHVEHRWLTPAAGPPGHMVVVRSGRIATAMRSAASSGGPSCGML
jgi:hypothetical protein